MYPDRNLPFYGIFVKDQVLSLIDKGINVDVYFVNGKNSRLNYVYGIYPLLIKIRDNHYDIIHLHHTYCAYMIGFIKLFYGMSTPIILTLHEGEIHNKYKDFQNNGVDIIKNLVFSKTIKRYSLKWVDYVITVQEDLLKALRYKKSFSVIPCGVDMDLFKPMDRDWCRRKINLPLLDKLVFFPASPKNGNKGFNVLKEAMKYFENNVRLITAGNIIHEEIPLYMCAADVIVQLSEYEASPMVLKEAMSVNVPLVFTDVGDVKKIIGDTEGCYICERTPESVAYYIDKALFFGKSTNGRDRIKDLGLGLSDIAGKNIQEYERLISICEGY